MPLDAPMIETVGFIPYGLSWVKPMMSTRRTRNPLTIRPMAAVVKMRP